MITKKRVQPHHDSVQQYPPGLILNTILGITHKFNDPYDAKLGLGGMAAYPTMTMTADNRTKFQRVVKENPIYLPLLISMGVAIGAVMTYMASEASTDHMYGIHGMEYSSLRGDPEYDRNFFGLD